MACPDFACLHNVVCVAFHLFTGRWYHEFTNSVNTEPASSPPFAGTYSGNRASGCTSCPQNSSSGAGAPACQCNSGYKSDGGPPLVCTTCSAGQKQTPVGSTHDCSDCPKNYYSPQPTSFQCTLCDPGKYAPNTGSSVCDDCTDADIARGLCVDPPTGTPQPFCNSFEVYEEGACKCNEGYTGTADACTPCATGKYKTSTGPAECETCPKDTTSPAASYNGNACTPTCTSVQAYNGAQGCVCQKGYTGEPNSCVKCTQGKFKNVIGNSVCSMCPADSTSIVGADEISKCVKAWKTVFRMTMTGEITAGLVNNADFKDALETRISMELFSTTREDAPKHLVRLAIYQRPRIAHSTSATFIFFLSCC